MAYPMALKLVCVVLICMVVGAPLAQAITCGQVSSSLAPCITFLQKGGSPSGGCCNGIKALNAAAKTTQDRQQVCSCLKLAAGSIPGINSLASAALPGKCGVSIPYKISPSTDCTKVK